MKILLIAGHGAGDSGAVATIDGAKYQEANLTREVVANLKPMLEKYGATVGVYPTSHNAYTDYNNGKLVSTANFKGYDYVLEIHFNAGRNDLKGDGKAAGDECYWPSRGIATGLENPITSRLFTGVAQRQSKSGQFAVINTANGYGVKANLLEVCFIDDADDMRLYIKNKNAVAQGIADGIAAVYKLKKAEDKNMMFKDIGKSAFKDDIEWGAKLGIASGYTDGTFKPDEPCTRGMMMAFIHRYDKAKKEGK